jgi:hypothetical protein
LSVPEEPELEPEPLPDDEQAARSTAAARASPAVVDR